MNAWSILSFFCYFFVFFYVQLSCYTKIRWTPALFLSLYLSLCLSDRRGWEERNKNWEGELIKLRSVIFFILLAVNFFCCVMGIGMGY